MTGCLCGWQRTRFMVWTKKRQNFSTLSTIVNRKLRRSDVWKKWLHFRNCMYSLRERVPLYCTHGSSFQRKQFSSHEEQCIYNGSWSSTNWIRLLQNVTVWGFPAARVEGGLIGASCNLKVRSPSPEYIYSVFTGWMCFPPLKQQCPSTNAINSHKTILYLFVPFARL